MRPLAIVMLLVFVALPLLEIALLIKLGSVIGVWATLAIIAGTAVLGFMLAQRQGLGVARRMFETIRSGDPPVEPVMEGMLLMFAAACLISPGLITDVMGALLLIPPLRRFAARSILGRHVIEQLRPTNAPGRPWPERGPKGKPAPGPTIEASYERIDERPPGGT